MSEKIPCTKCGAKILESTAQRTGGTCMPCKNGYRKSPPRTKIGKFLRRLNNAVVGIATVIILVVFFMIKNFFELPPSQRQNLLLSGSANSNFYFDNSYDFIEGNNRLIISIRSGILDYIVFAKNEPNNYPKYVGGTVRESEAVGHIILSANTDTIEITHSKKAYELTQNGVKEVPIRLKMSPFEVPKLIKLLELELTIEKLMQIKDEI